MADKMGEYDSILRRADRTSFLPIASVLGVATVDCEALYPCMEELYIKKQIVSWDSFVHFTLACLYW